MIFEKILVNFKMNKQIKYGIVGAGHLGRFHIQQASKIKGVSVVGFYDTDKDVAKHISSSLNIMFYNSLDSLLKICDAVSVVTPTPFHCSVALLAIKHNCHVFIEKPISNTIQDANKILTAANKKNIKVQVGHIERFNPAYQAFYKNSPKPLFIESHRLAPFNKRGSDVPVVLDLMIHDIDLVLNIVDKNIVKIHASGSSIISNFIDLANARIEFEGGVIANITASRVSTKQMRQMRVFEKNFYSALDLQQHTLKTITLKNKKIIPKDVRVPEKNALLEELTSFTRSIRENTKTAVSGEDGLRALEVAVEIQKIIEKQKNQ